MITNYDQEIKNLIEKESKRQQETLMMIPSENYASSEVLTACGSILSNKYSEGYPNKRYYRGNKFIDEIELLAIERAENIFNAEHVNVQPNSGSPANMAVYSAILNPGDKILAMGLDHGGHLTHGSPVNFSGKLYDFIHYGVNKETGLLNMEKIRELALKEKPKLIISGFTAYPREVDFQKFHQIAEEVGAYSMADISHISGLIAAGTHPSPLPFTDIVTTTTHKTLRGPRSAIIMSKNEDRLKEKYHPGTKKNLAKRIDSAVFPGLQGGPHENTIAAKAIAFKEAMQPGFKEYTQQIINNSKALANTLMKNGVSLVSNGTDNHLMIIDLIKTNPINEIGKGKEIAVSLEKSGIITNANTIPFDPSTPFKPSGIRLGTPALTTRGMKEKEMKIIGNYIAKVINNHKNEQLLEKIKIEIKELCKNFPIYKNS